MKGKIDLETRVMARKDFFGSSVDGDLVLFDPEAGVYYGSGPVGDRIWNLLAVERRVGDISEALLEQFDVDRETCEAQVTRFVADLHEKGLVRIV